MYRSIRQESPKSKHGAIDMPLYEVEVNVGTVEGLEIRRKS